jgi:release factor glutamine methyltransferase
MRANEIFDHLMNALTLSADEGEKRSMILWLLEERLGLSSADVLAGKPTEHDPSKCADAIKRLNTNEPLQYILGYSWFYGRRFDVTPDVLIPRPETELLVQSVIDHLGKAFKGSLLDIGTGSGCIAVTLSLELPKATIFATDVSAKALSVAQRNADLLNASLTFLDHNILVDPITDQLDAIVSNPPYIRERERITMEKNVMDFEPHGALFVPDTDPLIFHRTIAQKAMTALKPGGLLAMEINEALGKETVKAINEAGFVVIELHSDLDKKDRFVTARSPRS